MRRRDRRGLRDDLAYTLDLRTPLALRRSRGDFAARKAAEKEPLVYGRTNAPEARRTPFVSTPIPSPREGVGAAPKGRSPFPDSFALSGPPGLFLFALLPSPDGLGAPWRASGF